MVSEVRFGEVIRDERLIEGDYLRSYCSVTLLVLTDQKGDRGLDPLWVWVKANCRTKKSSLSPGTRLSGLLAQVSLVDRARTVSAVFVMYRSTESPIPPWRNSPQHDVHPAQPQPPSSPPLNLARETRN